MSIYPNTTYALIASSCIGLLSAYLAYRRGKNPFGWFAIGFLFGLFGIFAIFFAPFSRKKKAAPPAELQPYLEGPADKFWYYLDREHTQKGPMSHSAITRTWKEGKISPSNLVWHEDLAKWAPLREFIRFK